MPPGAATRRIEIVDIADFDLPLLDEAYPPSMGQYAQPHTKAWAATIAAFDAFVFVTPEYNHSMSGALKNAIDFLFREWNDKAAGFVSYGSVGGARAVEQLRLVMGELKVADVRAQCALSLFTDFENFTTFKPQPATGSGGRGDAQRPHPVGPRAAGDAARKQRARSALTMTTTATKGRAIAYRTFGDRHGPITRLMSPSGLGRRLKPFVFLDLFDAGGSDLSGFGWHPHSGIATLTYLWQGSTRYEDTTGAAGLLPAGGVEWFKAAGGAWHGGGAGNSGRSRGFQLWLALPPSEELGPSESIYLSPEEIPSAGPVSVLLGSYGGVDSPLKAPSPINYLAVRLKAGETWRYDPPAGHDVAWIALASGSLAVPDPVAAGEMVAFDKSDHGDRLPRRGGQRVRPGLGRKPSARPRARILLGPHQPGRARHRRAPHRRDPGSAEARRSFVRWSPTTEKRSP